MWGHYLPTTLIGTAKGHITLHKQIFKDKSSVLQHWRLYFENKISAGIPSTGNTCSLVYVPLYEQVHVGSGMSNGKAGMVKLFTDTPSSRKDYGFIICKECFRQGFDYF